VISPALPAFAAAACGVAAVWEALAAAEQARLPHALGAALALLRGAGGHGRAPSVPERRRLALLGAAALLAAGWLLGGLVAGLVLATAGPWAARMLVRARRRRWRADLARGAPAAARAIADALAGGHSVRGALSAAAETGGVPGAAGRALREAAGELALGEPTEATLERLRARADAVSWDTIVAAILLQQRAGGDLARLLRRVAAAQEEAARVEADARSATAQARFTAWLVLALPAGAAVLAELARPGAIGAMLSSPLAVWLVGGAGVCQLLALAAIRRIARVGD
jgi:tight adherence protein B